MTDLTLTITAEHIKAALAWSAYHRDSVRFIWGSRIEQRKTAITAGRNGARILAFLDGKGWVARSLLTKDCFSGRISAKDLNAALEPLLTDGRIEQQEVDNPNNPGRKTSYRCAKSVGTAISDGFRGFRRRTSAKAETGGTHLMPTEHHR